MIFHGADYPEILSIPAAKENKILVFKMYNLNALLFWKDSFYLISNSNNKEILLQERIEKPRGHYVDMFVRVECCVWDKSLQAWLVLLSGMKLWEEWEQCHKDVKDWAMKGSSFSIRGFPSPLCSEAPSPPYSCHSPKTTISIKAKVKWKKELK